ncbi:hypothetical protein WA158_000571 [Blastocystis sp. Blastoise]
MESIFQQIAPLWQQFCHATLIITPELVDQITPEALINLGVPLDQIRLFISMFVSLPLAYIHYIVPSVMMKKLLSIIFGVLLLQFTFFEGWIHSIITSVIVYLQIRFFSKRHMQYTVFLFSILYLAASHIYRMSVDYMGWKIDFTTYLMVFIIKFSSLGYNIYDGVCDKENIDKNAKEDSRKGRMYKRRQDAYVTSIPSFFDFLAYVYHFPGFMTGPCIFYREYIDTIEGKTPQPQKKSSRIIASLQQNILGIITLFSYLYLNSLYPQTDLVTDVTKDYSILRYLWACEFRCIITRLKYHGIWKISESVCILDGFGYEGKDEQGKDKWTGISNSSILYTELASDFSTLTRNWNIRTQKWLQMYTYERTNNSLLCLYTVSAFWHGFYPGYYIFFLTLAVAQYVSRIHKKKMYPLYQKNKYTQLLYDILSVPFTEFIVSYYASAFFLLSVDNALILFQRIHYLSYIVLVICLVVYSILPSPKQEKPKSQ